jgi:hypothetical protein
MGSVANTRGAPRWGNPWQTSGLRRVRPGYRARLEANLRRSKSRARTEVGNTPMNDRDVEAQPGDNLQNEPENDSLEFPVQSKRLVVPQKADVVQSDQARRLGPVRAPKASAKRGSKQAAPRTATPLLRSTGTTMRPESQAHPFGEPARPVTGREAADPIAGSSRLSAPHPLSRRAAAPRKGAGVIDAGLVGGRARRRSLFARPTARGLFGFAGLTATVGIVTALLVTLPNHPSAAIPTGSVYNIDWHGPANLPVKTLDFGPYFTPLDNGLLMAGTVNTPSTANSVQSVTSVTTVWASADGSTWAKRSNSGAFGIDGRRFVVQGISDDGLGGLVVVGNSLGKAPTDVIASAWHSQDGSSWTPMQVDSSAGQEMAAGVVSRPGAAVAAGNGVAWLSIDGRSWSPQVLPGAVTAGGSYTPTVVGSWNGGFVIIGLWIGAGPARSTAWYSSTGRDWTQAGTSLVGFLASGVASIGGKIVVVGSDLGASSPGLAASWSSSDGRTWAENTAPTDLSSVALDGVAQVGHSLLAFGAPAGGSASSIKQAGPTLAGSTPKPSDTELIWVSDDGVNWLPIKSTAGPLDDAHIVAFGNTVLMIGGSNGSMSATIGTLHLGAIRPPASPTSLANLALNVKSGNLPMTPDVGKGFTLSAVTNSADRFYMFATGAAGTAVFNSADGGLWVQEVKANGLTLAAVAGETVVTGRPVVLTAIPDGKGGILAGGKVTDTTGDNGMMWHMTKAGTWRQVAFQDDTPSEFSSIVAGSNGFVASSDTGGGSQIMYSTDGDTWQASSIAVGAGLPLSVATYNYGYVAIGSDPAKQGATTAWTSPDGRTWTMRSDWRLPPNVTAVFGMGYGLVATAKTALPGASASASPSGSASATPKATPTATPKTTPKATATPATTLSTTTWWWSASGVSWLTSGLTSSGGNWAVVGGKVVVFDAPLTLSKDWGAWTSTDGKTWRHPQSTPVTFAFSKTCLLASRGNSVVIVGWHSDGVLQDYFGDYGESH